MIYSRAVMGLLALRAGSGRMPEPYREVVSAADPLHELISRWPAYEAMLSDQGAAGIAASQIEAWQSLGIRTLAIGEADYPAALLTIFNPPPVLFVRGDLRKSELSISVVGSRSADSISFSAARGISVALARCNVTVISGLALGVDTAAHRGSLEGEGESQTIAVLGTGLDRIYPAANRELAKTIVARGGSLISQFEPDSQVYPSNFIARNQIIAGLSRGVVVIQAAKSSGSLATARFALEEGRDVFVVPGSFGDKRYEGSHQLLRDGAIAVTDSKDILDFYSLEIPEEADMASGSPIIKALMSVESLTMEELAEKTLAPMGALEAALLEHEIAGTIERLPGNRIRLGHLN